MTFQEFQDRAIALDATATVQVQSTYYAHDESRRLAFSIHTVRHKWVALNELTPNYALELLAEAIVGPRESSETTAESLGEIALEAAQ